MRLSGGDFVSDCPTYRMQYTRKAAKREARACGMLAYQCSLCRQYHVGVKRNEGDVRGHKAKKGGQR